MVRVVSCRYMRISCSEDNHPLFRRCYARSNRERGVKLLRCFPHCCPEHVQRCYCGSSIHILVTFAAELPAASQERVLVCARFESSTMVPLWPPNLHVVNTLGFDRETKDEENYRKLQPGEIVSLPASLLSTGKRRAARTIWIRADRGRRQADIPGKNAVLFVLNNHRFPKWLYSYDSSVTRTQREMTHHLVVYVCQLTGTSSQPEEIDATVLARQESPGFSLISFRRSGTNGSHAGCDLPAIDMDSRTTFSAVKVDSSDAFSSPSDDMDIDSVCQSALSNQIVDGLETKRPDVSKLQQSHKQQHHQAEPKYHAWIRSPQQPVDSCSGGPPGTDDETSWQQGPLARTCNVRDKAKYLLILWSFFKNVLVCDLGLWSDAVEAHVHSQWSRVAAFLRNPSLNFRTQLTRVVGSFLSQVFTTPCLPQKCSRQAFATRDSLIIWVTAQLFLRGQLSLAVRRRIISASMIKDGVNCKSYLEDQFTLLVSDVYDVFGGMLNQLSAQMEYVPSGNQGVSLPTLVDDVLTLVCTHGRFSNLRSSVMTLLMGERPKGSLSDALNGMCRVFTALTREAMITSESRNATRQRYCAVRLQDEDLLWSQRWLLEPGSVQVVDVTLSNPRDVLPEMGLVDVAQLVYEFGCVDLTIEGNGSLLLLQSPFSLSGDMITAPMTFVLDGKLRVFRVMPTGMPSMVQMAGGWTVGDYKATFSEGKRLFTVDLFSFAEGAITDPVQLRWINLSIRVVKNLTVSHSISATESEDIFAFVQGVMYGSTYSPSMRDIATGFSFLANKTSDRAAAWNEVEWAPLCEVEAGYIAVPCADLFN